MTIRWDEVASGVAHVVIDNPERRNALDLNMFQTLAAIWPELADDNSVRVVVISGAGRTAFCSGADLAGGLSDVDGIDDLVDRALLKTSLFPKPIVAAVNGHCVAGGLELALAADIRIASEEALFGFPEVRWGIVPSGGGAMKLIHQIGQARAMDLLLTGELVGARQAVALGLANEAVSAGEVLSLALKRAELIARNSPVAVTATKRAALEAPYGEYRARERRERELVSEVRASGHFRIGLEAFLTRSLPEYSPAAVPCSRPTSSGANHHRGAAEQDDMEHNSGG